MRKTESETVSEPVDRQRLDKWLWFARFARTRPLAAKLIADGHVRLNGAHVGAGAHAVRRGDVLTLALAREVLVVTVTDFTLRRGPVAEAVRLYRIHADAVRPA